MIDYRFTSPEAREVYKGELRRGTDGSAGLDMYAVSIDWQTVRVGFGIAVAIPRGWVGKVYVRSSTARDFGVKFKPSSGVIDSDYRGEIIAPIDGFFPPTLVGTRVAQLVVMPCDMDAPRLMDELPPTTRGAGGFGSTGNG